MPPKVMWVQSQVVASGSVFVLDICELICDLFQQTTLRSLSQHIQLITIKFSGHSGTLCAKGTQNLSNAGPGIADPSHKNGIYCAMQVVMEFGEIWMNKSEVSEVKIWNSDCEY